MAFPVMNKIYIYILIVTTLFSTGFSVGNYSKGLAHESEIQELKITTAILSAKLEDIMQRLQRIEQKIDRQNHL